MDRFQIADGVCAMIMLVLIVLLQSDNDTVNVQYDIHR